MNHGSVFRNYVGHKHLKRDKKVRKKVSVTLNCKQTLCKFTYHNTIKESINGSRALQIIPQNLSEAIKVAKKKRYHDKVILNSKNKMKTTWNIIKSESGRKVSKESVHLLNMNGNLTKISK